MVKHFDKYDYMIFSQYVRTKLEFNYDELANHL